MPFSTIKNISISVRRSDFNLALFKVGSHANPSAEKNEQDQAHILQDIYCKSFQIHQLKMIYRFENINHDTCLTFST